MDIQSESEPVTPQQARKTAFVVAAVLGGITILLWYRGRTKAPGVTLGVSAALVLIGTFLPSVAILFHRAWMGLAHVLGYINSRILLSLIYVSIFVPYGIISRLAGRDPLDRRAANRQSYWHKRKVTRQTKERFERLF